jgi:hypothetical protein
LTNTPVTVLRFGERPIPRPLRTVPTYSVSDRDSIDSALDGTGRAVVLGSTADVAAVLTRLMRSELLDIEVAHACRRFGAGKTITAAAQRVPLIRDETGTALLQAAYLLPPEGSRHISGEGIVDDALLFDGDVTGLRIEPTPGLPGLRAAVLSGRTRPLQWLTGRAVQIGTTGAVLVRDGITAPREVNRSTFYRHPKGWLRVL